MRMTIDPHMRFTKPSGNKTVVIPKDSYSQPITQVTSNFLALRFQGEDFSQSALKNSKDSRSEAQKLQATEQQANQLLKQFNGNFKGLVQYLKQKGVEVYLDSETLWVQDYLKYQNALALFFCPSQLCNLPIKTFHPESQTIDYLKGYVEAMKHCEETNKLAIIVRHNAPFKTLLHETFHLLSTVNGIQTRADEASMRKPTEFLDYLDKVLVDYHKKHAVYGQSAVDKLDSIMKSPVSKQILDEGVQDFQAQESIESQKTLRLICSRELEVREFLLKQGSEYNLYGTEVERKADEFYAWLYKAILTRLK